MCCYHSDHDYLKRSEVSSTNNTEYTKKKQKKQPASILNSKESLCNLLHGKDTDS